MTEAEERELTHWSRWGADGYPVTKMGRSWHIPHYPVAYKTKREAEDQWERYINMLITRKGEEARHTHEAGLIAAAD